MRCRLRFFMLFPLLSLAGCGPELSRQDLGTVLFDVPKIAGTDKPYQMPKLGTPLPVDEDENR
jgi:hypothetical protein